MTTAANSDRAVRITADKDKPAVVVEILDGDTPVDRDKFNPDTKTKRNSMAKAIGVDPVTFLAWLDESKRAAAEGDARPKTFHIPRPENSRGDVIVRRMDQRDDEGEVHALDPVKVLHDLLPRVGNDLVLKWTDVGQLACLDIDYHDRQPPHESWLRYRVAGDLAPRPYAWHLSKRGGLHLFYIGVEPFKAEELAAAAALAWRRLDPTGMVELKTMVRGPGAAQVHYSPGDLQDTSALLRGWVERTPADENAAEEWREAEGLEIGKRYDHTKCPINPTPGYPSTGDPVTVLEGGVYCHRCSGEGRSLGCRRPGFAPFTALTGSETAGDVGQMLKNICHWGHARFVLTRKYGLPEAIAEKAYRGALKALHHGTRRAALIESAFHKDTYKLTRVGELWYNVESMKPYAGSLDSILAQLPEARDVDENGKVIVHASTVAVLQQDHQLEDRGIPTVVTISGHRMTGQHMADPTREPTMIEMYPADIQRDGGRFLPRYVPGSRRNVGEAWGVLEEMFPGIDRNLVTLLMAGIATAQETQMGMHPMLFIAGISGTAKTTTSVVAARIMGAKVHQHANEADEQRWRQSIWEGARTAGMILFNEIVKTAVRHAKGKPVGPADPFLPLLTVTPENTVHVPYLRAKEFGRLPMFVLTEPSLSLDLREDVQVARRIRYWNVQGKKNWEASFTKHGIKPEAANLRTLSPRVAQACDAVMSDVIDRFFVQPMGWDEIAEAHGCKRIVDSDNFRDPTKHLREFFRLVCAAPKLESKFLATRFGKGYKKIERRVIETGAKPDEDADPLSAVYTMFADGRGADWFRSRKLTDSVEWNTVLGVDHHVTLTLADDGSNVYARFHIGRPQDPVKVNEEIIDPSAWEVQT